MTRSELRTRAYEWSQTDAGAISSAQMDVYLDMAATAFAREVGGVQEEVMLAGADERRYALPAGSTRVVGAWYVDEQESLLVEGDSTNGYPLNVLRDPDYDQRALGDRPSYYAVEQAAPPWIWFDAPIRAGTTVKLVVGVSAVGFGAGDGAVPEMPVAYMEALAFAAARYAALAMRDEAVAEQRHRQFLDLTDQYQQERAVKQPTGMTLAGSGILGRVARLGVKVSPASSGGGGATLDKASVYALVKLILEASDSLRIDADDARFTLTMDLTAGKREVLDSAVQVDSIQLSDRDLDFGSDGGRATSVTLPGVTIADENHDLGTAWGVEKINFVGDGIAARVVGTEAIVDVPGSVPGAGGLTGAQVDARIANNPRVRSLGLFEGALRIDTVIVNAFAFTVPPSGLHAAVRVGAAVDVPALEPDRELIVSVPGVSAATFQLAAFRGKAAAAAAVVLTDANSLSLTGGGVTYRVGYDSQGKFLATASAAGNYRVTITDRRIDLEDWARRSRAEVIPAAKLPPLGLARDQVDARVEAGTARLRDTDQALRRLTAIADGDTVRIALSDASYRLSSRPRVPTDEPDRRLRVAASTSAIDPSELEGASTTFDLSALLRKPLLDSQSQQLSAANAVEFRSKEGERMFLARWSGGEFLVGSDQPGVTFHIYIRDDRLDLRPEARRTGALESLIQTELAAHESTGVTPSQVDARIEPWARRGATVRVPEDHLPQDLDDLLDAVDEAGWAAADPADVRVATAFQAALPADLAAAQALVYTTVRVADVSPRRVNSYAILRFTADAYTARANYTLTVQSASGHVENRLDLGSGVTLGSGGGFSYLALEIDDVPVGATVEVQHYDRFRIDRSRLDTGVPVGTEAEEGYVLTRRAAGPVWERLRSLHGLRVLHDGGITGMTITALNAARVYADLAYFSPTFDLDDAGNASGEIHAELSLAIATRSGNDIGWGEGGNDLQVQRSGLVFASTLAGAADFVAGGTVEGVQLARADLYKGSALQGTVRLFLGHNGNNEAGYLLNYTPAAGADNTQNVAINARLEASFLAADTGGAAASHVGPLIATKPVPGGALAAGSYPAGAWVIDANAPAGVILGSNRTWLRFPRRLPDTMLGLVVRVKVGTEVVTQVLVPWMAYASGTAWNAAVNGNEHSVVYLLPATNDNVVRNLRLVVDRVYTGDHDLIYLVGNGQVLLANTSVELLKLG